MPKVSIIIPIYNVEKYIRQALDSIVNQTLQDIEIICVNDCTPDKSFEIVKEYASKDSRFVLLEQETNQGQGVARNCALDIAKGDYIMFLDSDDWYELDACEKAYNQIKSNQNDMVLFGYYIYCDDEQKKIIRRNMLKPFSKLFDKKKIVLKTLKVPFFRSAFTVMYIYKREFLNKNSIRYGTNFLGEDIIFACKSLAYCNDMSVIDVPLYVYRQRVDSASKDSSSWQYLIEVRKENYKQIIGYGEDKNWFLKYYIAYCINSLFYWFNIFSRKNPKISGKFYSQLRSSFLELKKSFDFKQINDLLDWKNRTSLSLCLDNKNLFSYILKMEFSKRSHIFSEYVSKKIKRTEEKIRFCSCYRNYRKKLAQIKKAIKSRKIRVLFYVTENQKWCYQSLYDILAESENFEPLVIVGILASVHNGVDKTRNNLEENYEFFKSRGMNVEYGYKNGNYLDLSTFSPDIVFYEQQWGLPKSHSPRKVSKYALTCYCPYGSLLIDSEEDYTFRFNHYMFKNFIENQANLDFFRKIDKKSLKNCEIIGYSKLDIYLDKKDVDFSKF